MVYIFVFEGLWIGGMPDWCDFRNDSNEPRREEEGLCSYFNSPRLSFWRHFGFKFLLQNGFVENEWWMDRHLLSVLCIVVGIHSSPFDFSHSFGICLPEGREVIGKWIKAHLILLVSAMTFLLNRLAYVIIISLFFLLYLLYGWCLLRSESEWNTFSLMDLFFYSLF